MQNPWTFEVGRGGGGSRTRHGSSMPMQGVSVLHHFDLSACTYQSKRRRLDMYSCALHATAVDEEGKSAAVNLG